MFPVLVKEVEYHTHSLLQVMVVESIVLTATTGGHLTVWDRKMMDSQVGTVRPLVETVLHQSGVNCLTVRRLANSDWVVWLPVHQPPHHSRLVFFTYCF